MLIHCWTLSESCLTLAWALAVLWIQFTARHLIRASTDQEMWPKSFYKIAHAYTLSIFLFGRKVIRCIMRLSHCILKHFSSDKWPLEDAAKRLGCDSTPPFISHYLKIQFWSFSQEFAFWHKIPKEHVAKYFWPF